jgi:aminopeptidase YwaD
MRYKIVAILLLLAAGTHAQSDKKVLKGIKATVAYLADDKLEGRRTGTEGEKLASAYIIKQFSSNGLSSFESIPGYLQPFEVKDGRKPENARFILNGTTLTLNEDYFPLAFGGDAAKLMVKDRNDPQVLFYNVDEVISNNKDNPHFDLKENIVTTAKDAVKKGLKAMFILNSNATSDPLTYDKNDRSERLSIPVIYVKSNALNKTKAASPDLFAAELDYSITEKSRTGHNVVGWINNQASQTVILGAHYDHLGYGEDHNSLYAGSTPMIHNGADDNASGTAALIQLSKILKNKAPKKFNYVFVAFSGEELGLYGSKYFTEHSPVNLKEVNYMINMDMVGRLNDSTHGITIGGYGTSPVWGEIIQNNDPYFKIKVDSAGSGPSDHTSFYRKDIPVLFFFTGTHSDYHKPSDDADKINYEGALKVVRYIEAVIEKTSTRDKLAFTKTREAVSTAKSSFKVTMGIMPDYTFSGTGVLVDGVSDNRPAQKAGIKAGDIILQLGEHKVTDVQSYMQALNKFSKGEATRVKLIRGKEDLELPLVF